MKTIPLSQVTADMIAAKDIITVQGQIIASRGAVFNDILIAKLRFYGIKEVTVESREDPIEETSPTLIQGLPENDPATYKLRTRCNPEFIKFQSSYTDFLQTLEETYNNIKNEQFDNVNFDFLLWDLGRLFRKKTPLDLFHTVGALEYQGGIYSSNVNVALISRGIGRWLHFPKENLDILTLCGLFHDIGKILVPEHVLYKNDKLSVEEFESMKMHTVYGQKLLKKVPGINESIVNAAMQHHERYDGSGYPMSLRGAEIDPYAAIVAIADVYEAMTAARPQRHPLSPFQVIEAFEADGFAMYNTRFILTFLRNIASAYQNRMVYLTDGRKARIIYLNHNKLSHPIVELEDKSTLDLSKEENLHILEII